ncbi:SDR family NAD(P)-dependent oxidoreductase [Nocardia colli]|uniref:SDR family NAD(P)-dependent oxidoreductase n=1 Tax=Nocardia colli TaxID=2545717 RepID=A0A5N0EBX6_9NOCA|nr:type I polyketide synthase [Nocardia colli]KAA8885635.1 SDR family NAD(P)-dependent oxidoreductase [Nocardia colli]
MATESDLRKYLKRAAIDLQDTRQRLQDVESRVHEPIAIVGMGCRFPGDIQNPGDLFQATLEGRDLISEFPADRGWDIESAYHPDRDHRGTFYVRRGGFLTRPGDFDPGFFGISPREALAMDPQQRQLLEVAWEAIENSSIDPTTLAGTETGVFAGVITPTFRPDPDDMGSFHGMMLTGNTGSIATGRIAYTLGLEGPAVTVDTACASSLVAVHQAVRSLRGGEISMALAGGSTMISGIADCVEFCAMGALASDGRCKSFADNADGFSVAEGVGVLVLERLSDARRNGRRVLAVIRGSAVNQDGASNGLTAPNGPAQQRVIKLALSDAQLAAREVDVMEAHGTGTALGDPIEATALLATYGRERVHEPLLLGSVKSNIGHSMAAAGVAGVIKMVEALRRGIVPPTLHADTPSTQIDWDSGQVALVTEPRDWPANGHPRRAAVSSFGISGTNAHLILEQAPVEATVPVPERVVPPLIPWVVSAKSRDALIGQARRLAQQVEREPELDPTDIGLSLVNSRTRYPHRAVVLGHSRDELVAGLANLVAGQDVPGVVVGAGAVKGKTVFVFSGQGSQRPEMGRELYDAFPVYRAKFDEICALFEPWLERSLRAVVFAAADSDDAALLDRTDFTQAGLFAVELALFELLRSWGVKPDVVLGHSIGELAAACAAGVWSLPDAVRLVAARGTLMAALPPGGAMISLAAGEEVVAPLLSGRDGQVGIAAVNSPDSVVISGVEAVVEEVAAGLVADGVKATRLRVSHAFHSPLMAPMLAEFDAVCAELTYDEATLPLVSNVTGRFATPAELRDPEYWVRHVSAPVRFADGVASAAEYARAGATLLEIGPSAGLTGLVTESLAEDDEADFVAVPVLRAQRPEPVALLSAVAVAHGRGTSVDWAELFAGTGAQIIELPTYAFDHKNYWVTSGTGSSDPRQLGLGAVEHPLLGAMVGVADGGGALLSGRLSLSSHAWLADHTVGGQVLLPGAVFVELALFAARVVEASRVAELVLSSPLVLAERDAVQIQVRVTEGELLGEWRIGVYARAEGSGDAEWTNHASGVLDSAAVPSDVGADMRVWPPVGAVPIEAGDVYASFAAGGYEYGPAFQGVKSVWRHGAELFGEVVLPESAAGDAGRFGLHPALLDAALQVSLVGDLALGGVGPLRLPFVWEGVSLAAVGASVVRVRLAYTGDRMEVVLVDPAGGLVAHVESLALRDVSADALVGSAASSTDALFELHWDAAPQAEIAAGGEWSALADPAASDGRPWELERWSDSGRDAIVLTCPPGDPAADPQAGVIGVLERVQSLLAEPDFAAATLVVVTHGGVAVDGGADIDPGQAAIWGLLRSAQSEHEDRIILLDLDSRAEPAIEERRSAVAAVLAAGEAQAAVRRGAIFVPLLARAGADTTTGAYLADTGSAWQLGVLDKGTLNGDNMVLAPADDTTELAPGQVRVAVRAAGMNFRDVLITLGMYPIEGAPVGGEGAGVVSAVGPGVTRFEPGDRVMGLFAGVGSSVVADQSGVVPIPPGWSFEQAAAVPIVFATAYHALVDLAGLQSGERVLIHAGTGGVGLAAIQLARHLGAELFVTASEPKWPVLRELGFGEERIGNSRTLDFEQKFLAQTGDQGVDVVLDSLAGEFVDASLRLLPRGGRFLEMGLTDLRDPAQIAAAYPGVRYAAFQLMELPAQHLQKILSELFDLFEAGVLQPLPVTQWDVRRAPEAFRYLSQARHIGKNVLTVPRQPDRTGTVLITGGTGGLGAVVARHLVARHGVEHLVLASRRGPAAEGATELVAELREAGASAEVVACDVSDGDAVRALVSGIDPRHPLTGIVHAAGVLDDGLFTDLNPERVGKVFAPKANAAWNLHAAAKDLPLSMFVLFSSIAGTVGSPGQSNYAAANAFLDALALYRQRRGLAATSIAWGLWEQATGMTASLTDIDRGRLRAGGYLPIATDDGMAMLDAALSTGQRSVVASRIDISALQKAETVPPMLRGVVRRMRKAADAGQASGLVASLVGLGAAEQSRILLDLVRSHAAAVLGHASAEAVGADDVFKDLGFDSLGAVEFRNRLKNATGLKLPTTVVFDYPTAAALAGYIAAEIVPVENVVDRIVAQVDALSGVCDGIELDRSDVAAVTERLTEIIRSLQGSGGSGLDLDAADDDEIFDFIDQARPTGYV